MPLMMSTANLITLLRLPLLILVVALLYIPGAWPSFLALFLLPVLYLMDWLDGYVARFKDEVTDLGSVLDIAVDRVVENVLWIVFVHLGAVPLWVGLVFIMRSFLVDGLREFALVKGYSAFGMMSSPLGKFLVAGRFMRGLYGLAKGLAFGGLALCQALTALGPEAVRQMEFFFWLTPVLVYLSVFLCILRGVPVLYDIRSILEQSPPPKQE
ncbi:MAG: CDP-alcohol phosphatidyltransferase family protein [Desulfarculaceae bacterium]|nr:CDP-alcohol phosphatidyltransferase family protein [Desulfarculaceae bacterium]MCF8072007.1 CDP-alcohol phosphatidyltransferase family protein [Desulfarculaceae bacterium]MCF8101524.1 CDP-alcohol phosphatidyltransferase family protein [Desulfarculaceae bacterium]MCF8115074.1 CDP-alcohol phosphatidyltransferase family protein [Desulfarculaceae bacterium]